MLVSDLQRKDIINVVDGSKLGKIIDIDINDRGEINYFIVEPLRFMRKVSFNKDFKIYFNNIKTIGNDVILVSTE